MKHSSANKKFIAKKSSIEGNGCFATRNIQKGETICIFEGEKISVQELKRRYVSGMERTCDPLQISERQYLDLQKPFVYFNHSCNPNAGMVQTSTLVAIRNIHKGEEITYDYSKTEWTWKHFGKNKEWEMICNCGLPSCRKIIKQFCFLPHKLQSKFLKNNLVQDFILRKVKKSKRKSYSG